jgi:D-alanine-D-alanine ligase
MGGASLEREFSFRSGNRVVSALSSLGWTPQVLELQEGWRDRLVAMDMPLCFLTTHGCPGEDGRLQANLEELGLSFTCATIEGCAIAMNKWASKAVAASLGIQTPAWKVVDSQVSLEDTAKGLATELGFPLVLKPVYGGSSVGVRMVRDLMECRTALETLPEFLGPLMAEVCVVGREVTVSVLEDDRGVPFVLPIMELEPRDLFYDTEMKLDKNKKDFVVPADLSKSIEDRLREWTLMVHRRMMMRDCSRSDFMIDDNGQVFYLETNAIPGLTENSDLPAQACAGGLAFEELVLMILKGAWRRSDGRR